MESFAINGKPAGNVVDESNWMVQRAMRMDCTSNVGGCFACSTARKGDRSNT